MKKHDLFLKKRKTVLVYKTSFHLQVSIGWRRISLHSPASAACVLYQCPVCTDKKLSKKTAMDGGPEGKGIRLLSAPWLLQNTAASTGDIPKE